MYSFLFIYCIYLLLTISITACFVQTLFKNRKIYSVDIFQGTVSSLIVSTICCSLVFTLLIRGISFTHFRLPESFSNAQEVIKALSVKVGLIIFITCTMYFLTVFIVFNLHKKALSNTLLKLPMATNVGKRGKDPKIFTSK